MRKNVLSLLILLSSSLFVFLLNFAPLAKAEMAEGITPVSGHLTVDTTWTLAGSPYIMVGGVIVDTDVFLTIEPGVVVKFGAGTNLVIDGGLVAQGNATHKITFTSNATSPAPGDWQGILIHSDAHCNITNSIIEYATTGIHFESYKGERVRVFDYSRVTSNFVGIKVSGGWWNVYSNGLTIEGNSDCGIYVNGFLVIRNSVISNNSIGVDVHGGEYGGASAYLDLTNSTVSHNTLDGVHGSPYHMISIRDSDIVNNGGKGIRGDGYWLTCSNSRISNNSGGGIYSGYYSGLEVSKCNITNNDGHGISSNERSPTFISGSLISNNSGNGVLALKTADIEYTTVIDNGNEGVNFRGGRIHLSNMYSNGLCEVRINGSNNVDAAYNWWGTTNETLIGEHIYDYFNNASLGEVSYVPFLNSSEATLTISTSGIYSNEPVRVKREGKEVGLVHDEKPLNMTVYSGHTQPNMGTFSLSIDNARTWDLNPNAGYRFVTWTGPSGSDTSNPITITVTADSSITAFYETQYLTNFTFKDSSGADTLSVEPSEIWLIGPNGSLTMLTSFLNQWLDEGTWTIKRIEWQGNNVKQSIDPTYTPTPGGTWTINCRVYLISFSNSFEDSDGSDLYMLPSSFKLTFPNGTISAPLDPNISYYVQNGTITWSSIIWQGTEVVSEDVTFDATNDSPTVTCKVYSLTVEPIFYDNDGTALVQPSFWSMEFPNGTEKIVSSPVTYNQTQAGEYSILNIIWDGAEVVTDITPTMSLTSDKLWSLSINCLLPTSLSISLGSSTSYVGFKVEINGNLTCNEVGVSGVPILLYYSVTGGEFWNDITLVNTTFDGGYSAVWIPSATGNYLARATWSGNSTYPGTNTIINLAVIPFREQNVFSVTSNSTVSQLAFNSTSRELSFTVTGPSGTTAYVNVHIAKTLIDNIADLKVYLDGVQLNYTATSSDDSWLLHVTYMHSTYKVRISLGDISFPFIETPFGKAVIYAVPFTAIVTLIALYVLRKKRARGHHIDNNHVRRCSKI